MFPLGQTLTQQNNQNFGSAHWLFDSGLGKPSAKSSIFSLLKQNEFSLSDVLRLSCPRKTSC